MTPDTINAQSSAQVVAGYLAIVRLLPRERQLDALAEVLSVPIDTEIRAPLLREFNNLSNHHTERTGQ